MIFIEIINQKNAEKSVKSATFFFYSGFTYYFFVYLLSKKSNASKGSAFIFEFIVSDDVLSGFVVIV